MSKLTGRCKEDFEKYVSNLSVAPYVVMLDQIPETYLNALIIDFFDSVGIYILIEKTFELFWFKIKETKPEMTKVHIQEFDSGNRTEATSRAIEKANLLYNESV